LCFLAAFCSGDAKCAELADLVLRDGKVVTLDDDRPVVQAIALRDDRIVAVGSTEEISPRIGPDTRVIELDGKLVVPGFIEGHGHFVSLGNSKMILDLTPARTWEDVVELVAAAAEETSAGTWIVGRGWHQGKWTRAPQPNVEGYPAHDALSRVTPNHPVMLTHRTGHMLLANAKAMQLAGITRDTEEIASGELLRDGTGKPIGVFRETAGVLIRRAYNRTQRGRSAKQTRDDLLKAIQLATAECLANGVTSFQDAGSSFATVDLFRELAERGELKVRLWVMLDEGNDALARRMTDYRLIGVTKQHLTVRGIKRMFDGALGTHGAWLLEPYDDLPGSKGHNTMGVESLRRTAELARQHGFQLCVHAIGDRANREVLDLFESLNKDKQDLRWRIEHAQHLHPDDIPRFEQLGVIASMQGVHCTSDAPFVIARLGQRRAKYGAYAWRSLLDAGAIVINGTDAPVESISPIVSFYASVTRKLPNDVAFFPEQRMTRVEALRSYTRDAAYAAFEDKLKGTLSPGKLADMLVLSRDILTVPDAEILDTKILYTIVGGRVLYAAE
jgi:hypothetical protein